MGRRLYSVAVVMSGLNPMQARSDDFASYFTAPWDCSGPACWIGRANDGVFAKQPVQSIGKCDVSEPELRGTFGAGGDASYCQWDTDPDHTHGPRFPFRPVSQRPSTGRSHDLPPGGQQREQLAGLAARGDFQGFEASCSRPQQVTGAEQKSRIRFTLRLHRGGALCCARRTYPSRTGCGKARFPSQDWEKGAQKPHSWIGG